MECNSTIVWWREDGCGKWLETVCETAHELPELVVSFTVNSITKNSNGHVLDCNLDVNNYASKHVSMPSIINGVSDRRMRIVSMKGVNDHARIVSSKWKEGNYLFKSPLKPTSNVSVNVVIQVNSGVDDSLSNLDIDIAERRMDENSPWLFKNIELKRSGRVLYQTNNGLLFADHGTGSIKLGGVVKVGCFDMVDDGVTTVVGISDIRIDPEKMCFNGSSIDLMSTTGQPPLSGINGKRMTDKAFPVMYIGDNKKIDTWWYILDLYGNITIRAPKSDIKKGRLSPTTITIINNR